MSSSLDTLLALVETEASLEVLLFVRDSRGKSITAGDVAKELGVTTAAAERELAVLCGQGFFTVKIGSDLRYTYRPMNDALDAALDELARIRRRRREP